MLQCINTSTASLARASDTRDITRATSASVAAATAGILSDSFNVLNATKFPCKGVETLTVLNNSRGVPQEGLAGRSDEGRAMVSCGLSSLSVVLPIPQKSG